MVNSLSDTVSDDSKCFCCGKNNPKGLHLQYEYPKQGQARVSYTVQDYFSGWQSMAHGGLISMLLDETMAHACYSYRILCVTAKMEVRFLKPLLVGTQITVLGEVLSIRKKIYTTGASIQDKNGEVFATANGVFFQC